MKLSILIITWFAATALFSEPIQIKVGDSLKQTIEVLGEPLGSIELRDKTLLLYPQGEVTLREDRATEIDLMTDEQFAADQERLRREREEWLQQQERMAAARIEEGRALKTFKMGSGAFAALPAKDRVDYWRSFQIRYPEIEVTQQIADALQGYEIELQQLRSQQRIADLEARVAAAEKEAATARLETEKLRDESEARSRSNYGLRTYTNPVIHSNRYYYRPPTITIYTDGKTSRHDNADQQHWKHDKRGQFDTHTESTAGRASRILKSPNKP
jgi:hypothetical protein